YLQSGDEIAFGPFLFQIHLTEPAPPEDAEPERDEELASQLDEQKQNLSHLRHQIIDAQSALDEQRQQLVDAAQEAAIHAGRKRGRGTGGGRASPADKPTRTAPPPPGSASVGNAPGPATGSPSGRSCASARRR